MKILITGSRGQLGYELQKTCPLDCDAVYTDAEELDISDVTAVMHFVAEYRPDVIINAAAYTAVDRAETEQQTAYKVNADAVGNLAQACHEYGVRFIHISTDFVFDGTNRQPYQPEDAPSPLGVYGASKLQGEWQLTSKMTSNYAIVRTSWVYSSHGNNFVKTMLRLMNEKSELGIVADQLGFPTWAHNLALICWQLAKRLDVNGIFHYSDTEQGKNGISWYDFAAAIKQAGLNIGLLSKDIPLHAITTADYPTPATRPAYSVMDSSKLLQSLDTQPNDWHTSMRQMLNELI